MAVETKPRLKPQRIAGPKADRLELRLGEERTCDIVRLPRSDRDLKTVFPGITRARDRAVDAVEFDARRAHEGELRGFRAIAAHDFSGLGALEREKSTVFNRHQRDARGEIAPDPVVVDRLARGIDDESETAIVGRRSRAGDHQVVDDAAFRVGELGVADFAEAKAADIARHELFERAGGRVMAVADNEGLAHMRNIEEAGMLARPVVLGDNAGWILHRHLIAGERHHAGAEAHMQVIERRAAKRFGRLGFGHAPVPGFDNRR